MASKALEWGPGISVLTRSPKDSDFRFAEEVTQMPENRGRRDGKEVRRNTWSHHLQTWPCLLQGRLPMPRRSKQSLGQVCRKESSFLPQDVVAEAPAFSFQPPRGEAPPGLPPAIAHLFCLPNIKNDKTPYFSSMGASQTELAMVSELVFLKVWSLCISGIQWSSDPPNQNLWGLQKGLKITSLLCQICSTVVLLVWPCLKLSLGWGFKTHALIHLSVLPPLFLSFSNNILSITQDNLKSIHAKKKRKNYLYFHHPFW